MDTGHSQSHRPWNRKTLIAQFVVLFLSPTVLLLADWKPPAKPDPDAILTEARADVVAARYKDWERWISPSRSWCALDS